MGRTKKLNCETNEKILGKLPKVKSNIGNLDFDEDDIDGISILSFKTFTDLKEYYPVEKIQPQHQADIPLKKEAPKKRRTKERGEKKSRVKRKATNKQQVIANSNNLTQFDKSESEPEELTKSILIKTEDSPPPSPLHEIPVVTAVVATSTAAPVVASSAVAAATASIPVTATPATTTPSSAAAVPAAAAAAAAVVAAAAAVRIAPSPTTAVATSAANNAAAINLTPDNKLTIKSEGCSTINTVTSTAPAPQLSAGPSVVKVMCGSDSPVYQPPSSQTFRLQTSFPVPSTAVPATIPPSFSAAHLSKMTAPTHSMYHGQPRHQVATASSHGLNFNNSAAKFSEGPSTSETVKKEIHHKFDPSFLIQNKINGKFPLAQELAPEMKLRQEYEKYLRSLASTGQRPLFPPHPPPRAAVAPPTPPNNAITRMNKLGIVQQSGNRTSAFKRLEKKWNSIHVYIAYMIYKDQQAKKSSDPLNGVTPKMDIGSRSFLSTKQQQQQHTTQQQQQQQSQVAAAAAAARDMHFPPYPGLHNLPPTPSTPFPNSHLNPSVHQSLVTQQALANLRGVQGLAGLANRFPPPSIRHPFGNPSVSGFPSHPGLEHLAQTAAAAAAGHRPSIQSYQDLSRLEQERLQQHFANIRSSELLSRSMYDSVLRREHDMQELKSREILHRIQMEEDRKRLHAAAAASNDPQSLLNPSLANLYMHQAPQNIPGLRYPGSNAHSPHISQFPHFFNRLDPHNAARLSQLISQRPKGSE